MKVTRYICNLAKIVRDLLTATVRRPIVVAIPRAPDKRGAKPYAGGSVRGGARRRNVWNSLVFTGAEVHLAQCFGLLWGMMSSRVATRRHVASGSVEACAGSRRPLAGKLGWVPWNRPRVDEQDHLFPSLLALIEPLSNLEGDPVYSYCANSGNGTFKLNEMQLLVLRCGIGECADGSGNYWSTQHALSTEVSYGAQVSDNDSVVLLQKTNNYLARSCSCIPALVQAPLRDLRQD
nr:hypothetical protein Iba_chr15aCG12230 [Ipomoea batatas]